MPYSIIALEAIGISLRFYVNGHSDMLYRASHSSIASSIASSINTLYKCESKRYTSCCHAIEKSSTRRYLNLWIRVARCSNYNSCMNRKDEPDESMRFSVDTSMRANDQRFLWSHLFLEERMTGTTHPITIVFERSRDRAKSGAEET